MNNEVLTIKLINVKNCFLHLSAQSFNSVISPSVCGLKLTTCTGEEFYFSPSHTPCSLITGKSAGISYVYANTINLKENEEVIVTPIYNIGSLQSIIVTPKSEDDNEILHSTASTVELSLLNQLRIVWPNQAFPVWVSSNISVILVVDSVTPNLKFGRLEEYSEVVVSNVVPKNDQSLANKELRQNPLPEKSDINCISILKEKILETNTLRLRCVPLKKLTTIYSKFQYHPYVVFTRKSSLPSWVHNAVLLSTKNIWKLKRSGEELNYAFVTLVLCEEDEIDAKDAAGFKPVFVSPELKNHLGLNLGQKVTLELQNTDYVVDISGILITSAVEEDEGRIVNEVLEVFSEAISSNGAILLNTKSPYPLKGRNVILTLRPLHAAWGFITSTKLKWLSINVNKFISENAVNLNSPFFDEEQVLKEVIPSYKDVFEQARISIELSLSLDFERRSKRFCDNTIYIGKSGTGKTELLNCLIHKIKGPPFYVYTKSINCCSLKGKRIEALSKYLSEVLQVCCSCEPSVLFLDDIDFLTSTAEENTEAAFHIKRISHKVVELIESYQRKHCLSVVATAKSLDSINPKIISSKGKCLFTSVIKLPDIDKNDRVEFLKQTLSLETCLENSNIDFECIASQAEGYTAVDLKKLCEKAIFETWQRKALLGDRLIVTNEDFKYALQNSKPSSLQQVNFYSGSKTSWHDVGGLTVVKKKLVEIFCWPTLYPDILLQCPVKLQNGVLIYGAPGTGKTLLAGALASESHMNFISIKGPELMSKYIGESEEGVRKLFEKAQAARPCLLFFDEFDSLAPRRGQDQTGVTDRVVNQLLTALDGVDPMSGVWVIAATSRPDLIDPAVLRPGRIGISVRCPLPDKAERMEILNVIGSKISLSKNVEMEEISELTEGFTGADIKGLFTSAQIKALDDLQNEKGFIDEDVFLENFQDSLPEIELKKEHIMVALNEIKPSLSESEKMRYETIYNQFERREPVKMKTQKVTLA